MVSLLEYVCLYCFMVVAVVSQSIEVKKVVTVKNYNGPMTKEILASLKDVEDLEIKNSTITEYPSHVFSLIPNLKKVKVVDSHFDIMDHNIYKNAHKLEEIYFANNKVPELPLTLLRHTTFEKIIISEQPQVGKIPKDFANRTTRLKKFECSACAIETIEEGAFNNLDKLEVLNLRQNSLKNIDGKVFSTLKNLKELNLSENSIEKISGDDLRELQNLEKINLRKNPLKELNLFDASNILPNLKTVDVRETKLAEEQIDELAKKTKITFITDRVE